MVLEFKADTSNRPYSGEFFVFFSRLISNGDQRMIVVMILMANWVMEFLINERVY